MAETGPWDLPPCSPDVPPVFETIELCVAVHLDGPAERDVQLLWWRGRPQALAAADERSEPDLRLDGAPELLVPYLCGLRESFELFAEGRVRGSVAALSAVHGLTHHTAVRRYWAARSEVVFRAVAALGGGTATPRN